MDSTGSRQCPMTDFSKNCNKIWDSDSIKVDHFLTKGVTIMFL
jgi:hypothetical protein